jgi:hypothetical protein
LCSDKGFEYQDIILNFECLYAFHGRDLDEICSFTIIRKVVKSASENFVSRVIRSTKAVNIKEAGRIKF